MTQRLLIVEDDDLLKEYLAKAISVLNVEVITASGAQEAFDALESCGGVDTVLSDINMPGGSGLELLHIVRASGFNYPFVMFTGYGDSQKMLEAIRLGASDFLQKPVSKSDLLNVLKRTLEIGARYREIQRLSLDNPSLLAKKIQRNTKFTEQLRAFNNKKAKKTA